MVSQSTADDKRARRTRDGGAGEGDDAPQNHAPAIDPSAPVVLVDGSSYFFRAFHALPPLTTSEGRPTGAIKGVVGMLRKLVADHPGSPVVVVFDAPGRTFRDDAYDQYKANRPPMPDDLREPDRAH
jgi:5'-3' exonuclease